MIIRDHTNAVFFQKINVHTKLLDREKSRVTMAQ